MKKRPFSRRVLRPATDLRRAEGGNLGNYNTSGGGMQSIQLEVGLFPRLLYPLQNFFDTAQTVGDARVSGIELTLGDQLLAVKMQPLNVSLAAWRQAYQNPISFFKVAQWFEQPLAGCGIRIPIRGFEGVARRARVNPVALIIGATARSRLEMVNRQQRANACLCRPTIGTGKKPKRTRRAANCSRVMRPATLSLLRFAGRFDGVALSARQVARLLQPMLPAARL